MNTFSLTQPWWFTESLLRSYLSDVSYFASGRMIDIGCGQKKYRDLFDVSEYFGVDSKDGPFVDVTCDAHHLTLDDESFDSAISNQVLEHVRNPFQVCSEVFRVLKPGSHFIISVPFISRIHGVPHDYWRFSEYGIRELLERSGFEVVTVRPIGGFWTTQSFLWMFALWEFVSRKRRSKRFVKRVLFCSGNIFKSACGFTMIPVLNLVALALHKVDSETLAPFNYVAVGKKPE